MHRYAIITLFCLVLNSSLFAQTAKVTVVIQGKIPGATAWLADPLANYDAEYKTNVPMYMNDDGSIYAVVDISNPRSMTLGVMAGDNYLSRSIYLSPGDDLHFKATLTGKKAITVTGKGANNNQPELATLTGIDLERFKTDTKPNRMIAAINKQQVSNKAVLEAYITKYKPSAAFIRDARINQTYFAAMAFYQVKADPSFNHSAGYLRNASKWQHVQDSLFSVAKLNNEAALTGDNYIDLIKYYVLREKERLWTKEDEQPTLFYKEWYQTTPDKGKPLFAVDRSGMLIAKFIDKHFTGKVAEFLYADLLKSMLGESNVLNIGTVFGRFKGLYPKSSYLAQFTAPVTAVVKRQSQTLNANMIFPPNNGSKFNSMADLLKLVKGKTVLVDMWGTWCSPCREEIEAHAQALHDHFKGKPVSFVYVANFDSKQEAKWKKLIAFYHLEGTHILANEKLTDDIMNKTNSSGYPSYIIIKKDGSYARAQTQHPVVRSAMIQELTAAAK